MVIDNAGQPGALLRAAADLHRRSPARRRAAVRSAATGSVTFAGGKHRAQPVVQRQPGAAPQPRRCRRARHRTAADPLGRARAARSRATSSSTRAASSSAERAPPPPFRSSTCAKRGLDPEDVIEPSQIFIRGSSISSSPGSDLQRDGPRHQQPLDHQPARSAGLADAPRFTGRADLVQRQLRFRRPQLPARPRQSSASAAKARPIRCSTSTPRRRSRVSTPA